MHRVLEQQQYTGKLPEYTHRKRPLCPSEKGLLCSLSAEKNAPCTVLTNKMTFDVHDRKTLFCFSVYTANTGSSKPSYELELLKMVKEKKASIFACDKAEVCGDVEMSSGGGVMVQKD